MKNTMKLSTYLVGLIYLLLWALVLGTTHKARSNEYSAYPDRFKYYDEQYRPAPPQQPQIERRINRPKAPEFDQEFIQGPEGKHLECIRVFNDVICTEY